MNALECLQMRLEWVFNSKRSFQYVAIMLRVLSFRVEENNFLKLQPEKVCKMQ